MTPEQLQAICERHERADKGLPTDCGKERLHDDRAALLAYVAELEAIIDQYVRHREGCPFNTWTMTGEPDENCTCGLTDALKGKNDE